MSLEKFQLNGAGVVITGGAGLLGRKHAEAIAEIGGIPIIVDINEELANKVASYVKESYRCNVLVFKADVTREKEIEEILKQIIITLGKPPYGLINNAALDPKFDNDENKAPKSRFEIFPLQQWEKEIKVGLTGAFICSKIFGREMAKVGRGVILNISSDLGIIAPDQRIYQKENTPEELQPVKPVTYSVIKHGIIGLTKYIATYWAKYGVRCNALAPGGVYNNHPKEFVEKLSNLIPLGRMAHIDEYKSAIQFLISDASSYMTGAVLVMDGGRSCW